MGRADGKLLKLSWAMLMPPTPALCGLLSLVSRILLGECALKVDDAVEFKMLAYLTIWWSRTGCEQEENN